MKKLILLLMTLFLSTSMFSIINADTATNEIYIHYYRYAGDYENWSIWVWQSEPDPLPGFSVSLENDTTDAEYNFGGKVAKINIDSKFSEVTKFGFIVRKGDWAEKDIDSDRFQTIPASTADGILHVYLVEGDSRIGTSLDDPDGPDKSPKFKTAYFTDTDTIFFSATETMIADNIIVKADNIEIDAEVSISGSTGTVAIDGEIDFGKKYVIIGTFQDESVNQTTVTFDGVYDSDAFEAAFAYDGDDLGAIPGAAKTTFRVWAPVAEEVVLNLYDTGTPARYGGTDAPTKTVTMTKDVKGTFYAEESGNLHGTYYTYSVTNGTNTFETIDPYAKSSGVNGIRGLVVDFSQINPAGFTYNERPDNIVNPTDAIIYELHVRDLTSHSSWTGTEVNRNKFLGLAEAGTTYQGVATGFDHLVDLGITHLQILPFYDFGVVDETKLDDDDYNAFNWGYMPLNFNVLEGAYASDPYDGFVRIQEMKEMVMAFTEADIRVNMDVVYNHTGLTADSSFNLIVPGYYHRKTASGAFSNGSGTGNETASERVMMRKFMIDSVVFWAIEYNLSGFRFDLMALHDIETMNQIVAALHEIDPTIMVYGEPWMGGTSPLSSSLQAGKANLALMPEVGAFNDDLRDAVKGSVFAREEGGFLQGDFSSAKINRIRYGIVGGVNHPDVDGKMLSAQKIWHTAPIKTINYVTAHDNNTLHDKLYQTLQSSNRLDLIPALMKQANAIVLTSQGVAFLHAGDEIMRSKPLVSGNGFDHNSYESVDAVNQIRWDQKVLETQSEVYAYYKGLIELRKEHPSFRMSDADDVVANIGFIYTNTEGVIAFTIANDASEDDYETIMVIHNANESTKKLTLPRNGGWVLVVNGEEAGTEVLATYEGGSRITVSPNSTFVLYQDPLLPNKSLALLISLSSIGGVAAVAGGVIVVLKLKRRKL